MSETRTFQAEIRKLLDILIHSLYTDREIFLRELISNASDALHRVQFEMLTNHEVRDPGLELCIRIEADPDQRRITISDTGVGMTRDELALNLGTIARSGAEAFVQALSEGKSVDQIGKFGVGFYSAFMVAAEVRVTSLSHRADAEAWVWTATGGDSYTLEPAERAERGTTVAITLKEDAAEFAESYRLIDAIHRHSEFVSFPIYVGEEVVNRRAALWRQPSSDVSEEAAADFYKQLTLDSEPPLLRIQASTDAPVQIHALLFIPSRLDRSTLSLRQDYGLKLYSRKIRIQEANKDLLPPYLRFVEGVVDSDDLDLNVSRETVQSSPTMRRIKRVLTHRVLDALKQLAQTDAERYATLWREFGPFFKEGIAAEPGDHDRLRPLLRFHTSRTDEALASLNDYVGRMAGGQRAIYYLMGDDLAAARRSPHLEAFQRAHLEVLYLVDPLDSFLPSALGEFEGFRFQNVDDAGLEIPQQEDATEAAPAADAPMQALLDFARAALGERVADVRLSDRLVSHPARLVSPAGSAASDLYRVRKLFEKEVELPPKVLELNPQHPLIRNLAALLARGARPDVTTAAVEQIYENSLLLEGLHPNPASMVERIQKLMEAATEA